MTLFSVSTRLNVFIADLSVLNLNGLLLFASLTYNGASLVAQMVKNLLQCRRTGFNPWVGKIPWRREWIPTPVFWPGEFHGWRLQSMGSQKVGHNLTRQQLYSGNVLGAGETPGTETKSMSS